MAPSDVKSTIGTPFIELAAVNSTNTYAMEQLQANLAGHGAAFFAHNQTAGKGQHGKTWLIEPGTNITLSVVLDTGFLLLSKAFPLSVMVAVACHDFFSAYAGDETSIKWPNDLYWRDRKAGGILIENLVRGGVWAGSVAGMGINLNQVHFPEGLKNPVSLKQITGKNFDTVSMAKELCTHLEKRYRQLRNGGFEVLWQYYNEHLYKRGADVRFRNGSIAFHAGVKGVNRDGELELTGAPKEQYRFGELEWVFT